MKLEAQVSRKIKKVSGALPFLSTNIPDLTFLQIQYRHPRNIFAGIPSSNKRMGKILLAAIFSKTLNPSVFHLTRLVQD